MKIKKREETDEYIELKGHEGPILQMDVSSNDLLASSSGDGTIRIWKFIENAPKVIKTIEGLQKVNEFSAAEVFSTPSFDPQGNLLAYPKDNSLIVLDTSNWETKFKLENSAILGKYTTCSFSPCGQFLAAGSSSGEISVWNVKNQSTLKGEYQGEDSHSITSLAWNPNSNGELAFCDTDGQLGSLIAKTTLDHASMKDVRGEEAEEDLVDDIYGGIDFRKDEADEDDDNENCVSLERLKNETLKNEDLSDDEESVKSLSTSVIRSDRVFTPKPFPLQPPFQPGSTPVDLEHRFMMWNHVGQVLCHGGDENSIITEFHDVTIHPSLHILNNLNHEMASLSTSCLVLATKETPCRLVCITFVSSGGKEWSTTMPDCEEIQAIAAGETFVAVATDAGFLRLFTLMGTQREVITVPGPVVALVASEDKLVVTYHTSKTSNKLSMMLLTHFGLSMTNRTVDLPLTANSKLTWLGFSDMGSVVASDSSGRVVSYNIKRNLWYPIGNLTNHISGASDNFFIISVSERDQKIRATLCRGTNYPLTTPRPIVREIEYSMPLCYLETEKSKLEEKMVRDITFRTNSSDKAIIENALKLFSSAINSEQESRAYEIVELIGDRNLISFAAKYASQKGRIHVSNKISNLLSTFDENEKKKQELLKSFDQDVEAFAEVYELPTTKTVEKQQDTSTPTIAPKPMLNLKKANPFKKSCSAKNASTPSTPLEHLTKKSIGYSHTPNHSDDENTPINSNTSTLSNRSIGLDTPRPGERRFVEYFSQCS